MFQPKTQKVQKKERRLTEVSALRSRTPPALRRLSWKFFVQHSEKEKSLHGGGGSDADEPDEKSHVHRMFDPFSAEINERKQVRLFNEADRKTSTSPGVVG